MDGLYLRAGLAGNGCDGAGGTLAFRLMQIQNGTIGSIMEQCMSINLSVKNVPDALADKLRERAARNHRSLQRELLLILERATQEAPAGWAGAPGPDTGRISIEQLAGRARKLFPKGTAGSVEFIRAQRDQRLAAGSTVTRRGGR